MLLRDFLLFVPQFRFFSSFGQEFFGFFKLSNSFCGIGKDAYDFAKTEKGSSLLCYRET